MTSLLKEFWSGVVSPFLFGLERAQMAALCYRWQDGKLKVLLITSRGTGRWILPKGWPMEGRTGAETAQQEAWEEAGVIASHVARAPLGSYGYAKDMGEAPAVPSRVPVRAEVYAVKVQRLADSFPEMTQRTRAWVTPVQAAGRVDEPELRTLLLGFDLAAQSPQ